MADNEYRLKFSLSDGSEITAAGTIVVPQGEKGDKGDVGDTGDPGGSAAAYVESVPPSAWIGSSPRVTHTIQAADHGQGTNPVVTVYDSYTGDQVSVGINVSSIGTVTLISTVNINCKVIII